MNTFTDCGLLTIWCHRSGLTLAGAMACCLAAPSQLSNQCWLIISELMWDSAEGKFTRNAEDTHTNTHTHIYTYIYICIYISLISIWFFFQSEITATSPRANEVTGNSGDRKVSNREIFFYIFPDNISLLRLFANWNSLDLVSIPTFRMTSHIEAPLYRRLAFPNLVLNGGMWK